MSGARVSSWYQKSRPGSMSTTFCVRETTMQLSTVGHSRSASSAIALSGMMRPPRRPSSAVMSILQAQSWMRSRSDWAEKPPKTIEWIAPMRAHASMTIGSSGIIGR